jgi:hypothetical protein
MPGCASTTRVSSLPSPPVRGAGCPRPVSPARVRAVLAIAPSPGEGPKIGDDRDRFPRALTARRSLALIDSIAFVVQMIVRISLPNGRKGTNSGPAFSQRQVIAG